MCERCEEERKHMQDFADKAASMFVRSGGRVLLIAVDEEADGLGGVTNGLCIFSPMEEGDMVTMLNLAADAFDEGNFVQAGQHRQGPTDPCK